MPVDTQAKSAQCCKKIVREHHPPSSTGDFLQRKRCSAVLLGPLRCVAFAIATHEKQLAPALLKALRPQSSQPMRRSSDRDGSQRSREAFL